MVGPAEKKGKGGTDKMAVDFGKGKGILNLKPGSQIERVGVLSHEREAKRQSDENVETHKMGKGQSWHADVEGGGKRGKAGRGVRERVPKKAKVKPTVSKSSKDAGEF